GTLAVRVGDLDPSLTKAGVCSLVCTSNPGICASLTIENLEGQQLPYTCQVLVAGAPTYPSPRPAFPFAEQLSALELQAGRAFGALCRPPLGLSARFDDAFCAPCAGASECGEGTCWSLAQWDEVLSGGSGECLVRCADHPDCPFGFSCESLVSDRDGVPFEHGTFCLPFEQTCGACRDLDGDGRGLGRCGPGGAVLGADCDDHDPRAYYDGAQMNHPFPEHCGAHDLNCNGLSDDAEQIGPAGFPAEHCTGCGQPCAGALPNASSACVFDHASLPSCVAECSDPSAWADCDGLLENGCEQPASDPARLYYLDADSDGYGVGEPVFACQADLAPEGYVNQAGDCDDSAA
ncbi:MAG TPA: hypothetical protein DFS52_25190, partial [Myxococcales bacterium]|nr:hypothetical protein [Myxococcales bacterium]